MRYLLPLVLVFCASCDAPQEAKDLARDKHAALYVFVKRLDSTDPATRPTPEQVEQMLRACLKDMESFDKLLNNWKPDATTKEVDVEGHTDLEATP